MPITEYSLLKVIASVGQQVASSILSFEEETKKKVKFSGVRNLVNVVRGKPKKQIKKIASKASTPKTSADPLNHIPSNNLNEVNRTQNCSTPKRNSVTHLKTLFESAQPQYSVNRDPLAVPTRGVLQRWSSVQQLVPKETDRRTFRPLPPIPQSSAVVGNPTDGIAKSGSVKDLKRIFEQKGDGAQSNTSTSIRNTNPEEINGAMYQPRGRSYTICHGLNTYTGAPSESYAENSVIPSASKSRLGVLSGLRNRFSRDKGEKLKKD